MTLHLIPRSPASASASVVAPVSEAFIHDREPPREWVEELRRVSPRSEIHGFLELVWEPGDPWAPGQRWILYELVTPEWANRDVLAELRGPHPRASGHICTSVPISSWAIRPPDDYRPCLCRTKFESWRGGPSDLITLTQWNLYQRTGCVGRPFWIIQGDKGGHKLFFTKEEQRYLAAAKLPIEPPDFGSLPYAPFDQRVVDNIMRFNRLQKVAGDLRRYRKQMGEGYAAYQAELERDMRKGVVEWLSTGFGEEEDAYRRAAGDDDITDMMERSDVDFEAVEDDALETFIDTGGMPDPETLYRQM